MTDEAPQPWIPVLTVEDAKTLNLSEVAEGYRDGLDDAPEPRPGGNRTRSYWWGWTSGMIDGGHAPLDDNHRKLAADIVRHTAAVGVDHGLRKNIQRKASDLSQA